MIKRLLQSAEIKLVRRRFNFELLPRFLIERLYISLKNWKKAEDGVIQLIE